MCCDVVKYNYNVIEMHHVDEIKYVIETILKID